MSGWASKRFWKDVHVVEAQEGYSIALDTRPMRTPGKAMFVVPCRALAEAVAAEWAAQEGKINPAIMPFTRAVNSAIDKVAPQFDAVAGMLAEYGGSDLVCYRAEAPAELARRQEIVWGPWLTWSAKELGAPLIAVSGVMHAPQPEATLSAFRAHVQAFDAFRLTGLHDLVAISGSLVLALAIMRGSLSAEDAWDLSRLDEEWQIALWGRDEEADAHAENRKRDFLQAENLVLLLDQD